LTQRYNNESNVFVYDHNVAQAEKTADYLSDHGCHANAFGDAHALLAQLQAVTPRLVLLQAEPGCPNTILDLIAQVRAMAPVPCILHAQAPDEVSQRVHGLENGVDDWIPVETAPREVLARIRAVLRRSRRPTDVPSAPDHPAQAPATKSLTWRLSADHRDLFTPTGAACQLTAAEFDLLRTLVQNRGTPVPRDLLSRAVFRRAWNPDDRAIDNLVARLRRKLLIHVDNPAVIKPVRGVGYVFTRF